MTFVRDCAEALKDLWPIALFVGAMLAALVGAVGLLIWQDRECLEWRETGGLICFKTSQFTTSCTPSRECVRFED